MKTIKILDKTPEMSNVVTEFELTTFDSADACDKAYEMIRDWFVHDDFHFSATRNYYVGPTTWTLTKVFVKDGIINVEYIENGTTVNGKPYCEIGTAGLRELHNWIYD